MRLGDFVLEVVVGSGGSGTVWRARHLHTGTRAALKVMAPAADRTALFGLKNEVQAIARLQHQNIVAILDTGSVDNDTAQASAQTAQPLTAHSPWLAVELASGGDLSRLGVPLPWPAVCDVVRTLLGALAHAHAHGVIHRDIKPGNILMCTHDDARPGLKLTDFGLASWDNAHRIHGGTPQFMAPEQFDDDISEVGPWTDLYAVGCVAYYLLRGAAPFEGSTWSLLKERHQNQRVTPLSTALVPPGVSAFFERMMHKAPQDRFRCAADAASALSHLLGGAATATDRLPLSLQRLLLVPHTVSSDAATVRRSSDSDQQTQSSDATALIAAVDRNQWRAPTSGSKTALTAAPPSTWRSIHGRSGAAELRLHDAGLSLWGLRPVPLVGRDDERDQLWSALRKVHTNQTAHVAIVRGASGVGKSRLAEWLCQRAAEVGSALVLKARFSANPSARDGFAGLIAHRTGLHGLKGPAALARAQRWLSTWLPDGEVSAHELCALSGRAQASQGGGDRAAVLLRVLSALAKERPLIVWLDDAHLASEALSFVQRVVQDAPELRALFLCTIVDDQLAAALHDRVEALAALATTTSVVVSSLPQSAHNDLCKLLLMGAQTELLDALRTHTEGNAMFAVHVVGDWIARGVVELAKDGLVLKPGRRADPPDALLTLWERRLLHALGAHNERPQLQLALSLAAVLGTDVDLVEWETACLAAGVDSKQLDQLVDTLSEAGLARRYTSGFSFVHVLVRGAALRESERTHTLAAVHASAARALIELWGTDTSAAAARIGRHLLAAGDAEGALALLLRAARAAADEGEVLTASSTLTDWERARTVLGLADSDARCADGMLVAAIIAEREARPKDALRLADAVKRHSKSVRTRATAACIAGRVQVFSNAMDAARREFDFALTLSTDANDRVGVGRAHLGLGELAYYQGDHERTALHYRQAEVIFESVGQQHDLAQLLWALGYVELEAGNIAGARALFERQRALCEAIRDRLGEANAQNALGELERRQGALEVAALHYKNAERIATRSGLSRRWMYRLNSAHVLFAQGECAAAAAIVKDIVDSPFSPGDEMILSGCWSIVLCEAALRQDLPAFDHAFEQARLRGVGDFFELDVALLCKRAQAALVDVNPERAERVGAVAELLMRKLNRTTKQANP